MTDLLSVRKVSKSYGSFRALSGVSFAVGFDEFVAIIGPNGAGKTTLVNVVTGLLKPDEIVAVANYVRSLSGLSLRSGVDPAAGKKIFADNCAACHGDNGAGKQDVGAPNLTDKIWLYGDDEATIINVIANGRAGVMPAWVDRLDPITIKSLAVYVHTLGGGQ